MSSTDDSVTVVSYNRPLTHGAAKALREYGILEERSVNDYGRWTVVELEREPPEEVLRQHELRVEREPDAVFLTDTGERVEIYRDADLVTVAGEEQIIGPEGAVQHAETNDWEKIE